MKRKKTDSRNVSDKLPTAANVDFPVFVPNEKGETQVVIGTARLRAGTLVVDLKDTASSVAIQRMIERGVLVGLGMVMLKPDEVNLDYQKIVEKDEAQSQKDAEDLDRLENEEVVAEDIVGDEDPDVER